MSKNTQGEIPGAIPGATYKRHVETVRAYSYVGAYLSLEFQANAKAQRLIMTFF